jgi:hypothetical protein
MATQIKKEDLAEFMKKQEKKGEQAAKALFQSKNVDTKNDPLGMNALNALKNGTIDKKAITSILQQGFDEFEKETGRKMTYSEMREMYG